MYNGTLQPFQFTEKVKAQYSTDCLRWTRGVARTLDACAGRADVLWLTMPTRRYCVVSAGRLAAVPYEVSYSLEYEPYVVVDGSRTALDHRYDVHLDGYGVNKASRLAGATADQWLRSPADQGALAQFALATDNACRWR